MKSSGGGGARGKSRDKKSESVKDLLESLPTLWDEDQYKSEYDLSSFMNSLSRTQ